MLGVLGPILGLVGAILGDLEGHVEDLGGHVGDLGSHLGRVWGQQASQEQNIVNIGQHPPRGHHACMPRARGGLCTAYAPNFVPRGGGVTLPGKGG